MKQQKSTAKIRYFKKYEEKIVSYETGEVINQAFSNKNKNLHNKKVGILGEDFACEYLENKGLTIVEKNFAVKFGEIDIVAISHETKKVQIIEVKTSVIYRNNNLQAIDNATMQKLKKVAKVGEFYVKEKFSCETPFSISVCLVYLNPDLTLNKIEFLENLEIF
jgi:putative endonuclease